VAGGLLQVKEKKVEKSGIVEIYVSNYLLGKERRGLIIGCGRLWKNSRAFYY